MYLIILKKKQISNDSNSVNQNTNVLNSFKIKATSEESDVNSEKYTRSKKSYIKYWTNVSNEINNIQDYLIRTDLCNYCKKGEFIPQMKKGY